MEELLRQLKTLLQQMQKDDPTRYKQLVDLFRKISAEIKRLYGKGKPIADWIDPFDGTGTKP